MNESRLLERITVNPDIFGGKPIIRGRRLAVEHILGMLAAGDSPETIRSGTLGWSRRIFRRACSMPARLSGGSGLSWRPGSPAVDGRSH